MINRDEAAGNPVENHLLSHCAPEEIGFGSYKKLSCAWIHLLINLGIFKEMRQFGSHCELSSSVAK